MEEFKKETLNKLEKSLKKFLKETKAGTHIVINNSKDIKKILDTLKENIDINIPLDDYVNKSTDLEYCVNALSSIYSSLLLFMYLIDNAPNKNVLYKNEINNFKEHIKETHSDLNINLAFDNIEDTREHKNILKELEALIKSSYTIKNKLIESLDLLLNMYKANDNEYEHFYKLINSLYNLYHVSLSIMIEIIVLKRILKKGKRK